MGTCVYVISVLFIPSCIHAACNPFIQNVIPGVQITLAAAWQDTEGCTPTQPNDRLIWQKKIQDTWQNMFISSSDNNDGFAIDYGDEYDIFGRAEGALSPKGHTLLVSNPKPCDSGSWKVLVDKGGVEVDTDEDSSLNITVPIKRNDIEIEPSGLNLVLAGKLNSFTCKVNSTKPKPTAVMWTFNNTNAGTGVSDDDEIPCGGAVWNIRNEKQENFTKVGFVDIACVCTQEGIDITSTIVNNVYAPAKILEEIISEPPDPKANETFTLTCTASGTDVSLSWTLNDTINLDDGSDYFKEPVITIETRPGLDYGQSVVTISTLVSIAYGNPTADSIRQQSGIFKCTATVLSENDSKEKPTQLGSIPLPNGDPVSLLTVESGQTSLECNVTAYPTPNYTWHRFDGIIDKIERIIDIQVDEDTNYTCKATNILGFAELYFIVRVEKLDGLSGGAIAGICIGVIAFITGIVALLCFLYKKKQKQKADEEVTAYAESRNTGGVNNGLNAASSDNTATKPPVYAEIDKNKKKKSPTHTAAPVYSEVNTDKKKKPNTKEPSGAVYSQVIKPDRPLSHLKSKSGSTNTGPVYSEVNKPKQGRLTPIENQSRDGGGGEYESVGGRPLPPIKHTRHYDNSGQRNEHGGLHYADVDFLRQGNGGTKQSQGTKNPSYEPTEYAQIDHRKSAGIVV